MYFVTEESVYQKTDKNPKSFATLFPATTIFFSPGSKSRLSAAMFMGDCSFPSLQSTQSSLMRQLDGPKVGNDRVK